MTARSLRLSDGSLMPSVFDKLEIPLSCPKCGHEITKTVAWINSHDSFDCVGCGATIDLGNVVDFSSAFEQADNAVDDLRGEIERLYKKG